MALCDFCFRDKSPLQPIYPRTPVNVCKACAYQIDRVIGFLRHSGITLITQAELSTPVKPLNPSKVAETTRSKIGATKIGVKPPAPI